MGSNFKHLHQSLRTSHTLIFFYGPGDAIAPVSRLSMVALHTLLFCVLHVAL